ncbi:MAG: 16S rRNA (uracil(1498)-N(3))-methyltransferase [Bryobacterales bacterium]|nr:16S rRNA (uracil(1498)-N(3))-methyltransferase [Bryobacterales bacterium]
MRRVFVDWLTAESAGVEGARAHHLARVVRLKPGEAVEVSDTQRLFEAEAEAVSGKEVVFRLTRELATPEQTPALEVHLAVIKFPRFELAVEKLTELGVAAIVPVAAERSDPGLVRAAAKRAERWRAIAEEAAQQSRRLGPPEIGEPVMLLEALRRPVEQRIFLDFAAPALREVRQAGTAALLIGPEGGWTDDERRMAERAGAVAASFGGTVLRAETAAIAGVAACVALDAG